jgi:hypothetical protein
MILSTTRVAAAAAALWATALGAGCSIEPSAPSMPTYEADVRPILMARCVRCHQIPQMGDPTSDLLPASNPLGKDNPTLLQQPPTAPAQFDTYADTNCPPADGGTCIFGALSFAPSIKIYISDNPPLPMPPPPAPALTSYQRDTINRWADETPTPLEK